jgi:hypothetical protein
VPAGAALVTLVTVAALPGAASAAAAQAHKDSAHSVSADSASAAAPAKVSAVIPATTKGVPAADIVSVKASGKTEAIKLTRPISVKAGNIIVVGIGKATPDGLIAKVAKVSGATLTATPATLRQAVPQGSFSATRPFKSVSSGALAKNLPCGAGGGVVPFEGNATVTVNPTISASWTTKSADVTISAGASGTASAAVNDLPPDYTCSPGASYLGATTRLAPFQVSVGSILVVVTPQLRWFVQGSVKTSQFITNEVDQSFDVSASLTDNGGKYTAHGSASTKRTIDVTGAPTFAPSSNLASVTLGPVVTMGLFGHSGPTVRIGLGSTLATSANAAPWWTDDATEQAIGTASTPDLAVNSATKTLTSHSTVAGRGPAPKVGLSIYQTYGTQQGAVRGPGGPGGAGQQIWLIAMDPPEQQGRPAGSQALDEVSPTTGAVDYWAPLPPYVGNDNTLLAYDDGPPAFDGSGKAWMIATSTTFSGAQSHYLIRYTPGPSLSAIYKLPASCSAPHGLSSAGDGTVWLSCNSAKAMRITGSGTMRTFGLAHVASLGSFAAGAKGSVWAVGYNARHAAIGLVRITSGGAEAYYATPRGITARAVAGNGSGRVIETAASGSSIYFESVSASGHLSHVATVPGKVGASYGLSIDAGGNVWLLVRGSAAKTGQYFLKLSSKNKTAVYAFSLPGCAGSPLSIADDTAGSADGSVWAESVTNCTQIGNTHTAYVGGLLRFKP